MNTILIILASLFIKASPAVLKAMSPILASASKSMWKLAFPIAEQIVQDVEKSGLAGFEKHKTAVLELEKQLLATGKVAAAQISHLHLGQIVLAAFAHKVADPVELVPPAIPAPVIPAPTPYWQAPATPVILVPSNMVTVPTLVPADHPAVVAAATPAPPAA